MAATAQSAIAVIGIDIGWSRVPPLSQGQLNVFLAQKDLSEPLMIIEPELSLRRREAVGGDLRGAVFLPGTVFNSTNSDCACAHNRRCDSTRDDDQLLDGRHDQLRSADDRYHLVLLTASTKRELAHTATAANWPIPAATPLRRCMMDSRRRMSGNEASPSQSVRRTFEGMAEKAPLTAGSTCIPRMMHRFPQRPPQFRYSDQQVVWDCGRRRWRTRWVNRNRASSGSILTAA